MIAGINNQYKTKRGRRRNRERKREKQIGRQIDGEGRSLFAAGIVC